MTKLVLDISAAYEVVLFRPKRISFLSEIRVADSTLAPDLFYSEAANVIWKLYRFEKKRLHDYELALQSAVNLVDEMYPCEALWKNAFKLACEIQHSVYDCMYLQLAREQKAKLLSMDKKLNQLAQQSGIPVPDA